MERPEVLKLLESNNPEAVEDVKKAFHEQFNNTKESWLLNGLVDYFIATGSMRCVDILIGVREPHDKYFFDKVFECLKNTHQSRLNILTLLGHVVYRQPTWLYKISQHPLLKEVLRILKTETDILILVSALLTLIVLLPMIPAYVGPHLQEIFEVFSRLAAWNTNNPNKLPEVQLVHLQVSLHSLFHRLYGMYPCNFLSYLRNEYSSRENLGVFSHTIKPMLETVKMHPLLVTASKDTETTTNRWKTMEHHDVVVECAKLSVDSKDEAVTPCYPNFRPRSESEIRRFVDTGPNLGDTSAYQNSLELKDFWSPSVHCGANTPPLQTPESSGPTSIPHTPITQSYVISTFPNQEGTSPPEAAIEATPETTPVKDSRHYMTPRPPPVNSTVVRALNNLGGARPKGSTSSTPSQSQPSSPMKKESCPFRFPENHPDLNSELTPNEKRKESIVSQRINSIFQDRLNVNANASSDSPPPSSDKNNFNLRSPAKLIPESNNGFKFDDSTQEDQEVLEINRIGEQLRIDSSSSCHTVPYRHCDSVIQDFHPPHEEELEDCQQDIGSPCNSGGLHMPNSRSMLNFQQSFHHRLRFFSQCGSDTTSNPADESNTSTSVGQDGDSIYLSPNQVRRAYSCPEIKKDRPSFTGIENLDESLELDYEVKKGLTNGEEAAAAAAAAAKRIAMVSSSTQTTNDENLTPYPYEHLFLGIFPPYEQQQQQQQQQIASQNPETHRYSPTTHLDKYIKIAAGLCGEENQSRKNNSSIQSLENELKTAKDQLVLLHLQLKFERQRREVHAERNRRLLGKSRNNRWLEDHNSALRDQLALLEKDIDSMNRDMEKYKAENKQTELKLQERIKHWQDKYTSSEKEKRELKAENENILHELSQSKQLAAVAKKEFQHVKASLFSVGNELKEAEAQASLCEQLKAQIEYLQKELILMGEMQQKYREKISQLALLSDDRTLIGQECCYEEVKNLNALVDSKSSSLEVMKSRVAELESLLTKKDMLVADQKRALKTVKEECEERLEAVEAKYRSQIATNRKLEEYILELNKKLETSVKRNKRSVSTAQDVLSLAERGGMNSPLSLSLSSSEGMSMSGFVPSETLPSRDLQSIVDEPEVSRIPELDEPESPAPS